MIKNNEHKQIIKGLRLEYEEKILALQKQLDNVYFFKRRADVLKRDQYACRICGDTDKELLECHHLTPVSDGGDNSFFNLITVCSPCHMFLHCNPKQVMKHRRWKSELNSKSGGGRPKGSKDKKPRRIDGYVQRWK